MIRVVQKADITKVADIWLDTNIKAHNFISAQYWESNYEMVKEMLLQAEVYVCESQGANTGQANGSCHSDTELRIENTGSTAHKSNRDKYRHKYTRTRDYRHRHIT